MGSNPCSCGVFAFIPKPEWYFSSFTYRILIACNIIDIIEDIGVVVTCKTQKWSSLLNGSLSSIDLLKRCSLLF